MERRGFWGFGDVHKWELAFQSTYKLLSLRHFLWGSFKDCQDRKQTESGLNTTSGFPNVHSSGFLGLPPSRRPSPFVPRSGISPLSMANEFQRLKGQIPAQAPPNCRTKSKNPYCERPGECGEEEPWANLVKRR